CARSNSYFYEDDYGHYTPYYFDSW
nr:immunoglobulin heavy chain junction region [Macaca mulatta]MOX91536.1 immunoglobulin heavy chain junction region [Macaca mulatta]MOX91644.1 immunoglobulin heavy chain junction region [Macaca mulatta]MOX91819.1 immunoglobulin heavy chain junction region [Macaca mulatta]MOX91856.1 immunoglobulin heavy chain junction region [Macaca mulatta]